MRRNFLITLVCIITLLGLTGCELSSSNLDKIPGEYTGLYLGWEARSVSSGMQEYKYYYVYKLENTRILEKACLIDARLHVSISDCNFYDGKTEDFFKTYEYEIDNISKKDNLISFTFIKKDKRITCNFSTEEEFLCKNEVDNPVMSGTKSN